MFQTKRSGESGPACLQITSSCYGSKLTRSPGSRMRTGDVSSLSGSQRNYCTARQTPAHACGPLVLLSSLLRGSLAQFLYSMPGCCLGIKIRTVHPARTALFLYRDAEGPTTIGCCVLAMAHTPVFGRSRLCLGGGGLATLLHEIQSRTCHAVRMDLGQEKAL